ERSARMSGRRMDDEPGRLGDHQQPGLLEYHLEGDVLGARRWRFLRQLDLQPVARFHAIRPQPNGSADAHRPGLDQPCGVRTRDPGGPRDGDVQPFPAAFDDVLDAAHSEGRPRERAGVERNEAIATRSASITTAESAKLKVGHTRKSMKSITRPRNGPGGRNNRSARFPTAPPRTSPRATPCR